MAFCRAISRAYFDSAIVDSRDLARDDCLLHRALRTAERDGNGSGAPMRRVGVRRDISHHRVVPAIRRRSEDIRRAAARGDRVSGALAP